MKMILALPLLTLGAPAFAETPADMLLICKGSSVAIAPESETSIGLRDNQGYAVSGTAATRSPMRLDFTVQLRIEGGKAQMNLPAFVAPQVNSGKGGWYRVKSLTVGERRIAGKVVFNFLSSSSFEIDRQTGMMTSSGGYQAQCVAADPAQQAF